MDMIVTSRITEQEVIEAALAVADVFEGNPDAFGSQYFASNDHGDSVPMNRPEAVKFCLLGGVYVALGITDDLYEPERVAVAKYLRQKTGLESIADFNDRSTALQVARKVYRTFLK